jgi:hypothetical protein
MIGGPLAFLVGFLTPSVSLGDVKAATRPRSYARAMPSQVDIAAAQATSSTLRGGLSGLSGSEADYSDEQVSGDASRGSPLEALNAGLVRRVPMPTSWYVPNLPPELVEGRGTGYLTGAYNKGWVRLLRRGTVWGATTRDTAPNVQTATLLEPDEKTPLPRDMAAAFASERKGRTRLMDFFGD